MGTHRFLASCVLAISFAAAPAIAQTVVDNANDLIAAIEDEAGTIEVEGVIELGPYQETGNALPAIGDDASQAGIAESVTIRGRNGAGLRAAGAGFRLAEILDNGRLRLFDLTVSGFDSPAAGGALLVTNGILMLEQVVIRENSSDANGGAVLVRGENSELKVIDSEFIVNGAAFRGGAVHLFDTKYGVVFERNRFVGNDAAFGCAISLERSGHARFSDNVFRGACDQALVDVNLGRNSHHFYRNTWITSGSWAYRSKLREEDSPASARMGGNLLVAQHEVSLCRLLDTGDFSGLPISSIGRNVATDTSCGFFRESDEVVDGGSMLVSFQGDPIPLDDSPLLDVEVLDGTNANPTVSRCGIADARGLGRPQDGDGDGVSACDRGALERRNGPDIGPAHSGAYFDPARPGEGYFVDILEGGRAWVTFFTYRSLGQGLGAVKPEKSPTWLFGLGRIVGNSVVVPEVNELTNSDFSAPAPGIPRDRGGLSLVFTNCTSGPGDSGTAYFRGDQLFITDTPVYPDVFTDAVRLSSVVPCGDQTPHPKAGLSGNFFDPDRNGEGIQVQWLPDGRVLVIWYTFAPEGRPIWMISDGATVEGNTVTAPMVYPASPTAFGPDFDASEIGLEPWGTLTLEYKDCNTIEFGFESDIEGFGSGSFTYQRLTQLAGTTCEL